jgi:hypothetical protein
MRGRSGGRGRSMRPGRCRGCSRRSRAASSWSAGGGRTEEERAIEADRGGHEQPERQRVQARKGQVPRPNRERHHVVGKARPHRHDEQEDHRRQCIVMIGLAASLPLQCGALSHASSTAATSSRPCRLHRACRGAASQDRFGAAQCLKRGERRMGLGEAVCRTARRTTPVPGDRRRLKRVGLGRRSS